MNGKRVQNAVKNKCPGIEIQEQNRSYNAAFEWEAALSELSQTFDFCSSLQLFSKLQHNIIVIRRG